LVFAAADWRQKPTRKQPKPTQHHIWQEVHVQAGTLCYAIVPLAGGQPEGPFRCFPGSSPATLRPGRPFYGPETLLRNIGYLPFRESGSAPLHVHLARFAWANPPTESSPGSHKGRGWYLHCHTLCDPWIAQRWQAPRGAVYVAALWMEMKIQKLFKDRKSIIWGSGRPGPPRPSK
jgi:hypothetical protein